MTFDINRYRRDEDELEICIKYRARSKLASTEWAESELSGA